MTSTDVAAEGTSGPINIRAVRLAEDDDESFIGSPRLREAASFAGRDAPQRFTSRAGLDFNDSREGKVWLVTLFFSGVFFMWPYQTMVQAQTFLSTKFPDAADSISPIMMMCLTLPIFLAHCLFVFTGCGSRISYTCRILGACTVIILLNIILCAILVSTDSETLLLPAMYTTAFFMQSTGAFVQPAYFEMAGLLPSYLTSQSVSAGIGAAGVVVCAVQMFSRLVSNGLQLASLGSLQGLTYFFLALSATAACLQAMMFVLLMRPSKAFEEYIAEVDHTAGVAPSHNASVAEEAQPAPAESMRSTEGGHHHEMDITAARFLALRHCWPSVLCIVVCFGSTTLLWPSISGVVCVGTGKWAATLQSWWFELNVFAFNLGDFLGRAEKVSLKWGAKVLGPMAQFVLSLVRVAIAAPLIFTAAAPQLYNPEIASWVVLVTIFVFGLTNGWLTTVCFMRAPKAMPAETSSTVAEQASTLLALGMYWGLFSGCVLAYTLTSYPLKGVLGKCFAAASQSGGGDMMHWQDMAAATAVVV